MLCCAKYDSHMNIGNPTRTLALTNPGRGEYLPVDDKAWEQGVCWVAAEMRTMADHL
jgi:hypothetical protein